MKITKKIEEHIRELALYRASCEGLPRKLTQEEMSKLLNDLMREIALFLKELGIDWRDYTGEKRKKFIKEEK